MRYDRVGTAPLRENLVDVDDVVPLAVGAPARVAVFAEDARGEREVACYSMPCCIILHHIL